MATRAVGELIQSEVLAALATAPASTAIANRYAADGVEHIMLSPAVVVSLAEVESVEWLTATARRAVYSFVIDILWGEDTASTADADAASYASAVRSSVAAYTSANLWLVGATGADFVARDIGMGDGGQEHAYRIEYKVAAWLGTSDTVTTA